MYKPEFGVRNKMKFTDESEYYVTLCFLAKSDGTTSINWEDNQNQGAWEHEVRIHCYKNIYKFPFPLKNKFTAGTGNVLYRINCNEFIEDLLNKHSYQKGLEQDIDAIKATIPKAYIKDFERGLAL